MNKRITSLVLALVMVLGSFTTVFAAETTKEEEKVEKIVGKDNKIQYVIDKGLVEGYEDGSYKLEDNIKRSEITKLLVLANGNKELSEKLQGSLKLYSDVDNNHWANGVIAVGTTVPSDANGQAMLQGYPDGSFKPENNVTYAELAKMLVVLAKKDLTADDVVKANNQWATLWLRWAAELGILDDVTVANSDAPATRGDAFTMVYNALYKMVSFKREAANDEIGVLSSLKNDKLVLNQDDKQTYTLTTDTVFVRTYKTNEVSSNVVKVKDVTNPDYYLGSLVRIVYNDNKEVTHILELGNPEYLALGRNDEERPRETRVIEDNSRWEGVSDNTVSTGYTNVKSAKEVNEGLRETNGFVEVTTKKDKTEVDYITFYTSDRARVKVLDVNDDTKVYVANPANNQMRKVASVEEALSLIGYQNYNNGYRIPNVYAGYDDDSFRAAYKPAGGTSQNLAKVIVFNSVNKNKSGEKFRIIQEAGIPGGATLEKKDGTLVERNFIGSIGNFPYNYGDLLDVVEIRDFSVNGYDSKEILIDHSKTDLYPIVEVKAIDKDSKQLSVVGDDGYRSNLYYRDADVFSAKRYDELSEGSKIQFRLDLDYVKKDDYKDAETLDVKAISILPRDTKLDGSLRAILGKKSINDLRLVGRVISVDENRVTVDVYRDALDGSSYRGEGFFDATDSMAKALEKYIGKEITFLAKETGKQYMEITDVRLNDEAQTPINSTTALNSIKNTVADLHDKYNGKVDENNFETLNNEIVKLDNKIDELKFEDKTTWLDGDSTKIHRNALEELKKEVKPFVDAKKELDKEYENLYLAELKTLPATFDKATVKAAADTVISNAVDTSKVDVTTTLKGETFSKGENAEVLVKLSSKAKNKISKEITVKVTLDD